MDWNLVTANQSSEAGMEMLSGIYRGTELLPRTAALSNFW